MDPAYLGYLLNLLPRGIRVPVLQVVEDRVIEKDAILRYDANVLPKAIECEVFQVLAVDLNGTFVRIKQSEEQVHYCGLAEARLAYNSIGSSRLDF